jgi:hypothetical protein
VTVRLPTVVCAVLLAVGATVLAQGDGTAAHAQDPATYVLKLGDTVRVEGATVGCQAARRGGDVVIDCRRGGSLPGSYGAFLSDRRVTVARFRTNSTAHVVFSARHGGRARRCPRAS